VCWLAHKGQRGAAYPESKEHAQEKLQLIGTLNAPVIQMGRDLRYEVVENHDLGARPVYVAWVFKPGSQLLLDMRLGFMCLTEFSSSSINEDITRAMPNLVDSLVFVVPSQKMTGQVKDAIESIPYKSILQLRKYVTVLTPSTLVSKTGMRGSRERRSGQTGEAT
jgi:hypothetical protein